MKAWYRSKTVWFNALTAIVAVAAMTPGMLVEFGVPEERAGQIRDVAFIVNIAGNLVIRFMTNTGIGARGQR